jgi:hypothetical protein
MRRKARVAVVSTRKLILWIYVTPVLVIVSMFVIFFIWAFTPDTVTFIAVKVTEGNLGHMQIRYSLNPYNEASTMVDKYAICQLRDGYVYNIPGDPANYRYVSCDNRVGYADEVNLSFR